MADKVEYTMERMLHDLIILQRKECLTKKQVKEIIARRREFEYRMMSKSATEIEYLEAIAYEKKLQAELQKTLAEKKMKEESEVQISTSEYCFTRRIITLYDRMLVKYRNRMDLIKQYARYLIKQKAYKKLSSAVANFLALSPLEPEIWKLAALCEYEVNGNSDTARQLFLRGLKVNPKSHVLWASYVKFELDFALKIRERHSVLASEDEKGPLRIITEDNPENQDSKSQLDFTVPKMVINQGLESINTKDAIKFKSFLSEELNKYKDQDVAELKKFLN